MIHRDESASQKTVVEITEDEQKKRIKRKEESLRDLWNNIKHNHMCIIQVPEGEERKKMAENMCVQLLGLVRFFVTPGTIARQFPLSAGFSKQEYWSVLPLTSPGELPDPGIEPVSLALAGGFVTTSATQEVPQITYLKT